MSYQAFSTPQIIINNETIAIVPNSLTYDGGEGEITVRAASTGGGSAVSVHTFNAESMISKVKFEIYVTADADKKIAKWKSNIGSNVIQFSDQLANGEVLARSFSGMSVTNAVERGPAADGKISIEWSGDQMA